VIDWPQVAASGIAFAYVKASEGTTYVDPMYATNRAGAERAGVLVGAFHYAQPDTSDGEAAAEADQFVQTAAFRSGELLPMLDLEETNGLSPPELQAWVGSFLDRVYRRTGLRAGIYVSPSFWTTYLNDTGSFAQNGYPVLWIAHWTSAASPRVPASNWGGQGWTIWQYDHRATIPGIRTPADVDQLAGPDLARLRIP
jgi:GH25 family lysozyme M1 (1,4-beta-N-acetylmuramidase)